MATPKERTLELTIISATDLKKVMTSTSQSSYAVAYVHANQKVATNVDTDGGHNPFWNSTLSLTVDEQLMSQPGAQILIDIMATGSFGSILIGSVAVPLTDITQGSEPQFMACDIHQPSGKVEGVLRISIQFRKKRTNNSTEQPESSSTTSVATDGYVPRCYPPQFPPQDPPLYEPRFPENPPHQVKGSPGGPPQRLPPSPVSQHPQSVPQQQRSVRGSQGGSLTRLLGGLQSLVCGGQQHYKVDQGLHSGQQGSHWGQHAQWGQQQQVHWGPQGTATGASPGQQGLGRLLGNALGSLVSGHQQAPHRNEFQHYLQTAAQQQRAQYLQNAAQQQQAQYLQNTAQQQQAQYLQNAAQQQQAQYLQNAAQQQQDQYLQSAAQQQAAGQFGNYYGGVDYGGGNYQFDNAFGGGNVGVDTFSALSGYGPDNFFGADNLPAAANFGMDNFGGMGLGDFSGAGNVF